MMRACVLPAFLSLFALVACEHSIQTTSGSDYLSRYADTATSGRLGEVDADVRRTASFEPTLAFPARIGLARLEYGRLTAIPADEGAIWQAAALELGPRYGEFVPLSPLIAEMVSEPRARGETAATSAIANIRRGAARQHLDYVIAYEVGTTTRNKANALSLADLTIIGMFVLPSRTLEVEASASAIMLDVRSGYPYATLTAHAEKSGVSRVVSNWSTRLDYADTATERAVANLAGEVELALKGLSERLESGTVPVATAATPPPVPAVESPTARALREAAD